MCFPYNFFSKISMYLLRFAIVASLASHSLHCSFCGSGTYFSGQATRSMTDTPRHSLICNIRLYVMSLSRVMRLEYELCLMPIRDARSSCVMRFSLRMASMFFRMFSMAVGCKREPREVVKPALAPNGLVFGARL